MPHKTKRISTKKEVHIKYESLRGSPSRPNFAHWWDRESLIHMDHPKPTSHDLFGPVDFRGVIAPPTKSSSTCVNAFIIDPQGTKSPYVLSKLCVDSFGFLAKHLQVFFSSLQVSKHLHNQTYAGFRDDMELGLDDVCFVRQKNAEASWKLYQLFEPGIHSWGSEHLHFSKLFGTIQASLWPYVSMPFQLRILEETEFLMMMMMMMMINDNDDKWQWW